MADFINTQSDVRKNVKKQNIEDFLDLIPDINERAVSFQVSDEFTDAAILAAFEKQMTLVVMALKTALETNDIADIRRQAHSLQGMGGAAGMPEISVVGEELSRAAQKGDFARCTALSQRLAAWTASHSNPISVSHSRTEVADVPEIDGYILIVDDEYANRLYLRKLLASQGATIIEAENGDQALELAKKEKPKLALVDVMMPGMSGYEVCEHLKNDSTTQDITIIMVTARTQPEEVEHAFVLGAFDYIRKPFHARELMARVRHALDLKRQSDELRQWQARMTREMDAAGALQRKLLAREPYLGKAVEIRFAHQASMSVGGDVFNAIPLPGERVCFYVADVAGHGVAPAMIATLLKALVEDVAYEKFPEGPAAMCNDIHHRFRHYVTNPECYASLFLAVLSPGGHCASFNCGHPSALLFGAQGQILQPLDDRGGLPIGLPDTDEIHAYNTDDEIHTVLPPDAVISIFSDGLTEAQRKDTTEFCGIKTLSSILSDVLRQTDIYDPANAVFERLKEDGYNLLQDDCTLLVARSLDPVALRLQRSVKPSYENIARLATEIEHLLRTEGWPEESRGATQVLIMEHGANVVDYGQLSADDSIDFRLRLYPNNAQLFFSDRGREWDFAEKLTQTQKLPVDSKRGRGLKIINAISYHTDFVRTDGYNRSCYFISRSYQADSEHQKVDQ